MGKALGDNKNLRGKIGTKIYQRRKDGSTVVYEAPDKKETPTRSEDQMRVRMQWSNLGAVHTQFRKTLKKGFQELPAGLSDYNAFVQANVGVCKVYIPKQVRLNGGCVLAPYLVTRGKLPSIVQAKNGSDVMVTDVALGSLVIGDETSVAEFSQAVIALNDGWQAGDQLTFFYGVQMTDAVTGIPRARIYGYKVMLNPGDSTPLLEVVNGVGFTSVASAGSGFVLGMDRAIEDGAAVWIHSREDGTGGLKVSTQFMYVDSSVLAGYQTSEAMAGAANSYGGINAQAVYLQPRVGTTGNGSTGNGTTGDGSTGGGNTEPGGTTGGGTTGNGTTGNGTTEPSGGSGTGSTGNGTTDSGNGGNTEPGGSTGSGGDEG